MSVVDRKKPVCMECQTCRAFCDYSADANCSTCDVYLMPVFAMRLFLADDTDFIECMLYGDEADNFFQCSAVEYVESAEAKARVDACISGLCLRNPLVNMSLDCTVQKYIVRTLPCYQLINTEVCL